ATKFQASKFLLVLTREQLDSFPLAVVKVNRQGVYTYGNRAMCEILGVDSVEGKRLEDVFRDDQLDLVRQHLDSRFSSEAIDEYKVPPPPPTPPPPPPPPPPPT